MVPAGGVKLPVAGIRTPVRVCLTAPLARFSVLAATLGDVLTEMDVNPAPDRVAAEGAQFPRWWDGGTIFMNLDGI
jgi:hypothetical protein